MALSEFETKKVEKVLSAFLERRRPPPHIRSKPDIAYRISGQSVEIFEVRPRWDKPAEKMESPVATATYVKTTNTGKSTGSGGTRSGTVTSPPTGRRGQVRVLLWQTENFLKM